jgi:hypothetical protein
MKQALKESFNRSVVLGQSRPTGQVRAVSDGGRRHQQVGAVCHALLAAKLALCARSVHYELMSTQQGPYDLLLVGAIMDR